MKGVWLNTVKGECGYVVSQGSEVNKLNKRFVFSCISLSVQVWVYFGDTGPDLLGSSWDWVIRL